MRPIQYTAFVAFFLTSSCGSAPSVTFPTDSEAANAPNPALTAEQEVAQKSGGASATPKIIPGLIAQKVTDAQPAAENNFHHSQCPLIDHGETEMDCPWAGMTRTLERGENFATVLNAQAPQVLQSLRDDQKEKTWLTLWGKSVNWDEGVKKTILDHRIIDAIVTPAGYPPQVIKNPQGLGAPDVEVMHAGLAHTYGYLFSNLSTAFGFKRKRWLGHELEDALQIPRGTFGPVPRAGTLFGNVTFFAGNVAFRENSSELLTLEALRPRVASVFDSTLFNSLNVRTLREIPRDGSNIGWMFQTDIITSPRGGILIYSLHHEASRQHRLITVFPILNSFGESLLDPSKLGADQPIQLRYNAYIDRLYGKPLRGIRKVTSGSGH